MKKTMYGTVDVDEALNNEAEVNKYFECNMDRGKCTPESESFKKLLPDVLKNKCAKCSENEKEVSEKVMKFLTEKRPDMLQQLVAKYIPQESSVKSQINV